MLMPSKMYTFFDNLFNTNVIYSQVVLVTELPVYSELFAGWCYPSFQTLIWGLTQSAFSRLQTQLQ